MYYKFASGKWENAGVKLLDTEIKPVFSEENYVPQTANLIGKHAYCSLLCHNDTGWNPLIVSREHMHKHNFGQTLKLHSAVVTLNKMSKSNILFSVSKQCINTSLVEQTLLIQKTELRNG